MRILHISTSDSGGAGMCCLRIHQSLLNAGIESKMLVLHNTQHAQEEYQYGFLRDKILKIPSFILRKIGIVGTERNKILKLQNNNNKYTRPVSNIDLTRNKWIEWADIIHLHWVNDYLDYPSFFCKVKKPIVWTLHDENLFYGIAHHHKNILKGNPFEEKYRRIKFNAVTSAKDLSIVFLSEMMFQNFENEKIVEGRRRIVINNSVNAKVFYPMDKRNMRSKYGIASHKKVFVFISVNIADPNKGLDILSDVLAEINPEAEILAIGGNSKLQKWINVRTVGQISNPKAMCELISCADYMAMPSYQEAFAQSPMEAMACGLPVVVFPVSGTSELVNDKNGIICEGFTREALKKGIETLMSRQYDPKGIRQDMIDRFSPKVIGRKYISLYNEILSDK